MANYQKLIEFDMNKYIDLKIQCTGNNYDPTLINI